MRRKLIAILAGGLCVGAVWAQTPPDPPTIARGIAAPCGCVFVCARHRGGYEMERYHEREALRQRRKLDAINREYYRRTGRKPVPYWDMPY